MINFMKLISLTFLCIFSLSFSRAQVNMHNGSPIINIPLFQYSTDESKLKLDISLNYTGGNGIKVDDRGDEVGLGWSLNTGGTIQRIRIGEPDDQKAITVQNDKIYILPGLFNKPQIPTNSNPLTNSYPNPLKQFWNPTYSDANKVYNDPLVHFDREHDQFVYTMNDKSGRFLLSNELNHNAQEEEISGNKIYPIEANPQGDMAGSIQGFYIIDPNGIKYTYQNMILTGIMNYYKSCYKIKSPLNSPSSPQFCSIERPVRNKYIVEDYYKQNDDNFYEIHVPYEAGYKIAQSWFISKIENMNTGKSINFNYLNVKFSENSYINASNNQTEIMKANNPNDLDHIVTSLTIFENQEDFEYPQLFSIDLPEDKSIKFIYSDRKDQIGKYKLFELQYFSLGKLQNKVKFNYGYFLGNSVLEENNITTEVKKRDISLALKSFVKIGGDGASEPPTSFEYYTGDVNIPSSKFPERYSFSKDHLGYYNGVSNNVRNNEEKISLLSLKEYISNQNIYRSFSTDVNLVQIGMIKKVINSYKSSTMFSYSLNKSISNGIEISSGGIRVNEIKHLQENNDFTLEKYEYINEQGICSADYYEPPGSYRTNSSGYSWKPNFKRYDNYHNSASNLVAVGTAIKNVAKFASGLAKAESKAVVTGGVSSLSAFFSYASLILIEYQLLKLTGLFTTQADILVKYNSTSDATTFTSSNNYIIPSYSSVKVSSNGISNLNSITNNGYTTYKFTSTFDNYIGQSYPPYSNKIRKIPFLYDNPKSKKTYDLNNNLLNEKLFFYENITQSNTTGFNSEKYSSSKTVSSPDDPAHNTGFFDASGYLYYGGPNPISYETYNFYYGKSYLTKTIERQYKGTSFFETKTDYTYIPNSHLQRSIKTTDSKGDITESKVFYTSDYTTPTEVDMTNKNIITPISTEVWKTKANSTTPKLISTSVTEYGTVTNGDIKPINSYSLKTDAPVDETTIGQFNPTTLIRDYSLITPNGSILYDSKGNSAQVNTTPNNKVSSIIYSKDNVPVATVTNANRNEIAYTSFEEKEEIEGGFIVTFDDNIPTPLPGVPPVPSVYITGLNPTGSRCINLAHPYNYDVRTTIPINKESILSFWASSVNFRFNGVKKTPTLTGPTINGWTYYQFLLPAGSPQQIITGIVRIDELRLYPSNAKMVTASFDLLNNKTAECDINNRIIYYESDMLGRPTKVMDEKRNIIKTYEYHFKN